MRKPVFTITLDVFAAGSCLEVELRAPMPSGRPRVHLVNVTCSPSSSTAWSMPSKTVSGRRCR